MPVDALEQAKYWLLQDEAVAIPTETVYGLAANALHPKAVSKIFAIKNRPTFDPLIVHCSHYTHFEHFASTIPPEADKLAEAFIPGPLTLLLPKLPIIPD
jgi:L-threonylcarbamoyladenylate synthase